MTGQLTAPQYTALRHWSEFGLFNEDSDRRIAASEWNTEPFKRPITSPWNIAVPPDQLPKLFNGFRPRAMEDKWFIYADGPDAQGRGVLHMFRSWTGHKIAEITLEAPLADSNGAGDGWGRFTEITWESSEEIVRMNNEQRAKESAREVCNWVLGAKLAASDT